ncbi:UbiA family prenyltransferase [Kitasatospora sp. NA04385]|uniref:UbiA family prenyltransferase n=1 Tax=Kitasatospora sp. NA04385 TaxID=2742135 RepID=UPI00158FBD51|nr:UbiA family prenyltransferase [Kitasatospora sp. NA04385]QKW21377.1 UbiA family prenyltransferase [Kitasatospora sp. NA04385]
MVQIVFLLRFAVGAAFVSQGQADGPHLAAGVLVWWLAVVAAYLVNGVLDVKEDRANGSARPIARGDLPERTAALLTAAVAAGSLLLSLYVPGLTPWVALFLLLGWLYSAPPFPAKRWSSTCAVVVFGLGWTSFAAGAATTGGTLSPAGLVFATVMSAWMALVGAVVKDLGDAEGDAVGGRRTVAVRHGAGRARAVAAAGALLVGAGGVLAALVWAPLTLAGAVPLAVGAGCLVVQIVRTAGDTGGDRETRRSAYRVFMRTQFAANAAMLLALLLPGLV